MKEIADNLMLKKNDIVEILIDDIGSDGEGIGRHNGMTLFVKGAVTGDKVRALILKMKKSYGYAKILEILIESPHRVKPLCPISMKCGGCQLSHISYEQQLEYKVNKVKNNLGRIGGVWDYNLEPVIAMEEPYYYRNKAQFPVGCDKDGNVIIGFYAAHTHSIIDAKKCYLQPEFAWIVKDKLREFLSDENISIYDEATHTGLVRHVLIRLGFITGDVCVCLVLNGNRFSKNKRDNENILIKFVDKLKEAELDQNKFKIKSICLNENKEKTNVILGDKIIPIYGETYITDYIGNIKYKISPLSFYQVNPYQMVKLYDKVISYANLTGNEIVWDVYCGIGTISLYLAKKAKQVYGVEIVPQAVEDAKENARINGIENVEFFVGAAEDVLPEKYEQDKSMQADIVVVDPPRKGCDAVLLNTIVNMEPKRIVYVSCDPGTLARDVKYLREKGYELKDVAVVDQFGMTVHVEVVTCLHRVNS